MAIHEDPGFLRLFLQSVFDILIKPIQGAWQGREKTIHGYVASICAIGIFLYFLIAGLYSSFAYFYGMFYEDQFNVNLQQNTLEALNKIYTSPDKYGKDYIDSTKTGSISSGNGSFFPIGTPRKAHNNGSYEMLFLVTNQKERAFKFLSVILEGDSWFKRKIIDIRIITTISVSTGGLVTPNLEHYDCDGKILYDINRGTGILQSKCNLTLQNTQNFK